MDKAYELIERLKAVEGKLDKIREAKNGNNNNQCSAMEEKNAELRKQVEDLMKVVEDKSNQCNEVFANWTKGRGGHGDEDGPDHGSGRGARKSCVSDNATDLVLVVDESGSIQPEDQKLAIDACEDFVDGLHIGISKSDSRVGMVMFSSASRVEFGLDDYPTKVSAKAAIRRVKFRGGGTNIASGIKAARDTVFGGQGRKNVAKVMIVITDGKSETFTPEKIAELKKYNLPPPDTKTTAAEEREWSERKGITIYAVGVGKGYDMAELIKTAGDIDRVYTFNNFSSLKRELRGNVICRQ